MSGTVYLVGVGPGRPELITPEALAVIQKVSVVIGQPECFNLVHRVISFQEVFFERQSPLERCRLAVEKAQIGGDVAIVSIGDPGTFAIASTFLGYVYDNSITLNVQVVPGLNLACYAASLLGAPLGNDSSTVTLTDQGIPWSVTVRRLEAAASADFVIVIYNPMGKLGPSRLGQALGIIAAFRSGETPVGLVSLAGTPNEKVTITTISSLAETPIPVDTIVIVGNSQSYVHDGKFNTPRFYKEGVGY
jgi:precorrin-3B C17-methyltransferase